MQILMCQPRYYDVLYSINSWMTRKNAVNRTLAQQQWLTLKEVITDCGAQVTLIEPQPELPDMVFTANAALILEGKAYLAQFAHPERAPERTFFKDFLTKHHFNLYDDHFNSNQPELTPSFEGAGDGLAANHTLFLGLGLRSSKKAHTHIAEAFPDYHCQTVPLIDPYFYHLDTCFCPLNHELALYWPGAFSEETCKQLQKKIHCLAVPESEAKNFACNAVVIDQHVIIPAHCPVTQKILEDHGFTVHSCELSEFIKAGGAAKCLTLRLDYSNTHNPADQNG